MNQEGPLFTLWKLPKIAQQTEVLLVPPGPIRALLSLWSHSVSSLPAPSLKAWAAPLQQHHQLLTLPHVTKNEGKSLHENLREAGAGPHHCLPLLPCSAFTWGTAATTSQIRDTGVPRVRSNASLQLWGSALMPPPTMFSCSPEVLLEAMGELGKSSWNRLLREVVGSPPWRCSRKR